MRRLLQSVYAYCESHRENANSTYFGEQLTELPAKNDESNPLRLLSLGIKAPDLRVTIPVAACAPSAPAPNKPANRADTTVDIRGHFILRVLQKPE